MNLKYKKTNPETFTSLVNQKLVWHANACVSFFKRKKTLSAPEELKLDVQEDICRFNGATSEIILKKPPWFEETSTSKSRM